MKETEIERMKVELHCETEMRKTRKSITREVQMTEVKVQRVEEVET